MKIRVTSATIAIALAAGLATGMLAGCTSVESTTTEYVGAPHPAPTDPARVAIMRSEPTIAHDRLGEVVVALMGA